MTKKNLKRNWEKQYFIEEKLFKELQFFFLSDYTEARGSRPTF